MSNPATTVTLRREDWELIQEVLNYAIKRLDYIQSIPGGLANDWTIKIINLAVSIKPVEEPSPVKSEEKCEHDKGNYYSFSNKPGITMNTYKSIDRNGKFEKDNECPYCPKPEEKV